MTTAIPLLELFHYDNSLSGERMTIRVSCYGHQNPQILPARTPTRLPDGVPGPGKALGMTRTRGISAIGSPTTSRGQDRAGPSATFLKGCI
jgi:hypothetical protein